MTKETNEQQIVYLAALLHDIGKFIERARKGIIPIYKVHTDKYRFNNKRKDYGAHKFYSEYWCEDNGLGQEILELIKYHHYPFDLFFKEEIGKDNFIKKQIIRLADGLSSSERLEAEEDELNEKIPYYLSAYQSIFSKIYKAENTPQYYEANLLDIKNIFPTLKTHENDADVFNKAVKTLLEKNPEKGNFYNFLQNFLSYIPAQTPSKKHRYYPDVSLFDHLKTTAAIAVCLAKNTSEEFQELIKKYSFAKEKGGNGYKINPKALSDFVGFHLLQGDFSGIQSFIFDVDGKGAAKALKGRSVYIQLLSEVVCKYLIKELGLEEANIIYNGGGNFYILIPECLKDKAEKCQTRISKVLYQAHKGELYLAMGYTPLKMNDFSNFAEKWYNSRRVVVQNKVNRWEELIDEKNLIFEPFDSPEKKHETPFYNSFIKLTESLRNAEYLCFHKIESKFDDTKFKNNKTITYQEVFHALGYHVCFHTNETPKLCEATFSYKLNDTEFGKCDGFRFMVHRLPEETDFSNIAQYAKGDKKLGLLKMDIDNLGEIFHGGLSEEDRSISRVATLSRNIHLFFEGYMNTILEKVGLTEDKKQTIYPVYAGGDDLLFIGPYDVMIVAAKIIREDFKKFVANNENINLSAALLIMDDKFPMKEAARRVDEDLKKAKSKEKKNAICVMGEVFCWEEFGEMDAMNEMLINMIESKDLNKKESRSLIQKIKNSTRGFDKIMQNAEKGKIDFEKLWRFKYYLRDMKSANDIEKEKLIEWYDNLILNQTIEKDGNKKYNPMILPVACRIAELKTKN